MEALNGIEYLVNSKINSATISGGTMTGVVISNAPFATSTDPAVNAATSTAIVDSYNGVLITLTGAGNAQTIQSPTTVTAGKMFTVINNDTSEANTIAINGITLTAGNAQTWIWDGTTWTEVDIGITSIPVQKTNILNWLCMVTIQGIDCLRQQRQQDHLQDQRAQV